MNKSDIVYLGGGSSIISGLRYHHLMMSQEKTFTASLKDFLLKGGLLMGLSAGALVMGIKNVVYQPKTKILEDRLEGLHLFPGNIQVHYEEYGLPEHLNILRAEYPNIPVTALDTQTAIAGKLKFKITMSELPENLNNLSRTADKIELLTEDYTVLGSKTVVFKGKEEEMLFDGMKCPKELSWKRLLKG